MAAKLAESVSSPRVRCCPSPCRPFETPLAEARRSARNISWNAYIETLPDNTLDRYGPRRRRRPGQALYQESPPARAARLGHNNLDRMSKVTDDRAQATDLASKTAPKFAWRIQPTSERHAQRHLRARIRSSRDPVPIRRPVKDDCQRCLRRTLERAEPRDWPP